MKDNPRRDAEEVRHDERIAKLHREACSSKIVKAILVADTGSDGRCRDASVVGNRYPPATYAYVAKMLNDFGVAYIHVADTNAWAGSPDLQNILPFIGPHFDRTIIANAGITPDLAEALVGAGDVDAVAFGRMFIANPDLPERIRQKGPYTELRPIGLYGGDQTGYVDYPSLGGSAMAAG
jgi:2,4-dienoyl-CoA reductase-like NADH-dependent reductase (Old Yellow Enzyme family)